MDKKIEAVFAKMFEIAGYEFDPAMIQKEYEGEPYYLKTWTVEQQQQFCEWLVEQAKKDKDIAITFNVHVDLTPIAACAQFLIHYGFKTKKEA